jgi:2C-methyl-D-erythritol 2,4-cyclodiphosphate synthase
MDSISKLGAWVGISLEATWESSSCRLLAANLSRLWRASYIVSNVEVWIEIGLAKLLMVVDESVSRLRSLLRVAITRRTLWDELL